MIARVGYAGGIVLGVIMCALGLPGVLGVTWTVRAGAIVPLGGLELAMDPLAGLFLLLVGGLTVPASLYALGYLGRDARGVAAYLAFVVAMAIVPLAANVVTFLLAWELMSLASYVLVLRDRARPAAVRAGWVYAVMTHAGLACLLVGMLLLASMTNSVRFADWRVAAATLPAVTRSLAWILLALGFAGKAGVIPLHVWLPRAHPAAPSHVSALMSGVLIKLGVFGLIRASLEWLAPAPPWWGAAVLVVGAVSAVVGVLYALVDHDLKRLLAFHSIENVGIILIGLGAGMLFQAVGLPALAVLGVVAALYHTVNHGAFKALLFLGAGSVVHATGTLDMEEMGGLIKPMPWTAAFFLVGSAAIAALPPLNGFVSEWLTFQVLFHTVSMPHPALNVVMALCLAALALTAGLAAACFVKAFGITFLALPRSAHAERAHEAAPSMLTAMGVLAAACVGLGFGPTVIVPALAGVANASLGSAARLDFGDWLTLRVAGGFASLSTLAVAVALGCGLLVPLVLLRLLGAARGQRAYETWGCGRMLQTARMEYTATAFANPFKRIFDFFYRSDKQVGIDAHPESRLFVTRIEYRNPTRSIFEDWFYRPVLALLRVVTSRAHAIQSGSANLYLTYILAVLLILLLLS